MHKHVQYIRKLFSSSKDFIPLHAPAFWGKEKQYLNDCIDSTFVSSVGPYVNRFEADMAMIVKSQRTVATVNGTAALHIALQLAGVKSGNEVLTQALTFVATVNAIAYLGAKPVFLDVDIDTMGLSPKAVEGFLEDHAELREEGCFNKQTGNRIAACVPMHTFGFPVHMDELIVICAKWNIAIVEDAAESLGSYYKGRHTGSLGLLGTFSFNGNKIVTAGGGGAIVTNSNELADAAKHLTTTAKKPHIWEYSHDAIGYNFRMPNINAALLCAQLEQLTSYLEAKRFLAQEYNAYFTKQGIKFRVETPETKANYWLMCVEMKNKTERDDFLTLTNESGVMTRPIWQLMNRLPMYQNCITDGLENSVYLEERIVNIPSSVRS